MQMTRTLAVIFNPCPLSSLENAQPSPTKTIKLNYGNKESAVFTPSLLINGANNAREGKCEKEMEGNKRCCFRTR